MYTQIVLLLFALRSISANTLVHVQNEMSTMTPQERSVTNSIVAKGSLRPFTNSHAGYQFANWDAVNVLEHQEPPEGDKVIDKIITNSDSSSNDADIVTDTSDRHDETDKLDDTRQAKEPKNQMFDKIKEKYQKHHPHRFVKRIKVEPTENVRRKRQFNYYQPLESSRLASSPVLRDEYGNILHDNMNAAFSGGYVGNVPRAYGINQRNDLGYSYNNHINGMPNEPIYNPYTQTIQQRPVEIQTVNNYPYKTVQQSPQEVELINGKPNQQTNEAMYNQLISQQIQQKQVESQTLNPYKPVHHSPQEVELTNGYTMYSQPTNEAMYNQYNQPIQQNPAEIQTLNPLIPVNNSPQEVESTNGQPKYSQPTSESAMYKKHISQPVQQIPVEAKTVNKNQYKLEQQSPQENKAMLPIPEKTETNNINKLNQAPQEVPKQSTNKNITQIFEKETTKNNVDVSRNARNNEDMIKNVNQISKKIGSIKEKVKDRFATANLSGILTSPGGRKLLQSYGIIPTGKEEISKNISAHIIETTESKPDEFIIDTKSEELNNTIVTKDISNISDTLVEVSRDMEIITKEQTENPVDNRVILNTENQNNDDSVLNQTDVENAPESLSTEMLNTTKISISPGEPETTQNYPEPYVSAEIFKNENSITETQEQTYTDLTTEHKVEFSDADRTINDENEEKSENKEKYEYDTEFADDRKSEALNLNELFNRDEFWEWLSNWTSAYMEILNENIKALVKDEVAKQMEELYLDRKTESIESLMQKKNHADKVEIRNEQENENQSI